MKGVLGRDLLVFTCCLTATSANVPSDILESLTPTDIADIIAFNSNNSPTLTLLGVDNSYFAGQIVTMEQRIERQSRKAAFQEPPSIFKGLEFACMLAGNDNELPFIYLTYLKNEERSIESAGITAQFSSFSGCPDYSTTLQISGSSEQCNYQAFSLQTKVSGSEAVDIVQFAVYTNYSAVKPGNILSKTGNGERVRSTISISGNPRFVASGIVLLSKLSDDPLQENDVRGIVGIIAGRVCEKLITIPTGTCENGTPVTGDNGLPACSCSDSYFGVTCGILCNTGKMEKVPETDSEECECDFGWGGDTCDVESPVTHFIARTRRKAKTCQSRLSNHEEYAYVNADSNLYGVNPFMRGTVQHSSKETRYMTPRTPSYRFQFGSTNMDTYHATLDRRNDVLAAVHIPGTLPIDNFEMQHTITYSAPNPLEKTTTSWGEVGVCNYHYQVVQRYHGGLSQAAAELFFVVGVQDISAMPRNTSMKKVVDGNDVTDVWTAVGEEISDVMFGFTLIGRNVEGEMPAEELDAVATCYALEACHALPIDCASGAQTWSPSGPMCQCTGNVTGIQCRLPLC